MTEEQIERHVERKIDALDRLFLAGGYTQPEYDAAIRAVDAWAAEQYQRKAPSDCKHGFQHCLECHGHW